MRASCKGLLAESESVDEATEHGLIYLVHKQREESLEVHLLPTLYNCSPLTLLAPAI